ncbi:MAG TPA: 50S ribosomal protein L16 [Candidatus Avilachnospira avistercoris]|nr:50S ribosomal protein L16 [Candidatus Avilachnospira avistercoris]
MLMPKRTKYRKQQRGSMKGRAQRGNKIAYGEFGLVATESCWLKANQIEAARIAMTRYIKRGGQVWIKVFPDKPVTSKPIGVRMGSGKGAVEFYVAVVKPGRVLFEIAGVPEETAREALRLAMHKLPLTCKIVSKADLEGGDDSEK